MGLGRARPFGHAWLAALARCLRWTQPCASPTLRPSGRLDAACREKTVTEPLLSVSESATRKLEEMKQADLYDYQLVNEEGMLDATAARVRAIIERESRRDPPRRVTI